MKVLCLVHGEYSSHTVRVLEVAKALRQQGKCEIVFSGDGPNIEKVKAAKFEVITTPNLSKSVLEARVQKLIARQYELEDVEWLYQVEMDLQQKVAPDIILRDHLREVAAIAAKVNGIFDVMIQNANLAPYMTIDFRPIYLPPIFNYLPDAIAIPLVQFLLRSIRQQMWKYLHQKAKQLQLPYTAVTAEGVEPDLVLWADSELLFPYPQKAEHYHYLGPLLNEDEREAPTWLEAFSQDERLKVLISTGTTGIWENSELFEQAFSDNKYAIALHTTASQTVENFYGNESFNISKVLPYTDVFVTHCGTGSTYMGLYAGVPMVGIYNHFEQQQNCIKLEKLGVGRGRDPRLKMSPQEVRFLVDSVLSDPKFRERAKTISSQLEDRHAPQRAANLIRQYYTQR